MPNINLRFFGLGLRASGSHSETRFVPEGSTIEEVWEDLRFTADQHDFLARVDERQVSILLNGKLISRAEGLRTVLEEQDMVTFMVLVTGGSSRHSGLIPSVWRFKKGHNGRSHTIDIRLGRRACRLDGRDRF